MTIRIDHPLTVVTNVELGIEAEIRQNEDGRYSVVLVDTDSGLTVRLETNRPSGRPVRVGRLPLMSQAKTEWSARMGKDTKPQYEKWRHGGWYVTNARYPSGAVGCVSRNYEDHQWRIVCMNDSPIFPTRDAAASHEIYITKLLAGAGE